MALRCHDSVGRPVPTRQPTPPKPDGTSFDESRRRVQEVVKESTVLPRQRLLQRQQQESLGRRSGTPPDNAVAVAADRRKEERQQVIDDFVADPTQTYSSSQLEKLPWWLRMVHDDTFRKAVCTRVTAAIRHFEETGNKDPQVFVAPPNAWNPESALNRVPGDGLTYRWLVPFPPTGWVHLPLATSRMLDRPGGVGVHVFVAADAENYAAKDNAAPHMTVNPIEAVAAARREARHRGDRVRYSEPPKCPIYYAGRGITFPARRWNSQAWHSAAGFNATASDGGDAGHKCTRHKPDDPQHRRDEADRLRIGNALMAMFRDVNDEAARTRPPPPLEFVGTLRASHRLLRARFLYRALHETCQGTVRNPYGPDVICDVPPVKNLLAFTSYSRQDLTDSRIEFLFSSDVCRSAMRAIYLELPKDINGRATKAGFVQLVLDLNNIFMPSFYTQSNIEVAEDEWVCRGTRERPDLYQFFWFFFDYPLLVLRSEYMSEDLYAAFWRLAHHLIFVCKRHNTDGYADHLQREALLKTAEAQRAEPGRRVLLVQRRIAQQHAAERHEAHRHAIRRQYDDEWRRECDLSAPSATADPPTGCIGSTLNSNLRGRSDDSPDAPAPTGNVFLDRRRDNVDLVDEWKRQSQSGGASDEHHDDLSYSATAARADEDKIMTLEKLDAEIAQQVKRIEDFDKATTQLTGDDRDDVDSLLSYCSDLSESEFDAKRARVRSQYHQVKSSKRESERSNLKRTLRQLYQSRRKLAEQVKDANARARLREEQMEFEQGNASLLFSVSAAGGGDASLVLSPTTRAGPAASVRFRAAALSVTVAQALQQRRDADQPEASATTGNAIRASEPPSAKPQQPSVAPREPIPDKIVQRARRRRQQLLKMDEGEKAGSGKYSMFAPTARSLPLSSAPAPPSLSETEGGSATARPRRVIGMSAWSAEQLQRGSHGRKFAAAVPVDEAAISSVVKTPLMPNWTPRTTALRQPVEHVTLSEVDRAVKLFPTPPPGTPGVPISVPRTPQPLSSHVLHGAAGGASESSAAPSRVTNVATGCKTPAEIDDITTFSMRPEDENDENTASQRNTDEQFVVDREPRATHVPPKISRLAEHLPVEEHLTRTRRARGDRRPLTGPRQPTSAVTSQPSHLTTSGRLPVKVSRSLLQPSRAIHAAFPVHPRTVLVGQPASLSSRRASDSVTLTPRGTVIMPTELTSA
jgi:hypothetical protein